MNRLLRLTPARSAFAALLALLLFGGGGVVMRSATAGDETPKRVSSRRSGKLPAPTRPPVAPKSQAFTPLALPDSMPDDLRAAWALRQRVGRAYWPDWVEHSPAPILLRGKPFDFFVNDPAPPSAVTAPRDIPGGGGFFQGSLERLPNPEDPTARVERFNDIWLASVNVEGGRGGSRADFAALVAYRDFLAYEANMPNAFLATSQDMERILTARISKDLIAWIDSETVSLRRAVAAKDESQRIEYATRATSAWKKAQLTVAHSPDLIKILDWMQEVRRYEGTAQYVRIVLQSEARSVVAGDTASSLPPEGSTYESRARPWLARIDAGSERQLLGAHLGTLTEAGAYYCLLLDDWAPGWRKRVYEPGFQFQVALDRALTSRGNSIRSRG